MRYYASVYEFVVNLWLCNYIYTRNDVFEN
jgi:hypothetical protein